VIYRQAGPGPGAASAGGRHARSRWPPRPV